MNQSNEANLRLNFYFIAWIVLANGLLLLSSSATVIDYWLGTGFFWAVLIPLTCLVWLNPRRSWGLFLATAGFGVWLALHIGGRLLPNQAPQAMQKR